MEEQLFTMHLDLTQPELSSLLMAQITQTRLSRVTLGEVDPITLIDLSVLQKLIGAQQQAFATPCECRTTTRAGPQRATPADR